MLNTLIDVLGRTIDKEQGLKRLTVDHFCDRNSLQDWPLEQLLLKSPHLEYLKIGYLETTVANSDQLMEFFAKVATGSSCLHTLEIEDTRTSE